MCCDRYLVCFQNKLYGILSNKLRAIPLLECQLNKKNVSPVWPLQLGVSAIDSLDKVEYIWEMV